MTDENGNKRGQEALKTSGESMYNKKTNSTVNNLVDWQRNGVFMHYRGYVEP
jgi:hypothetical protein